MIGQLRKLLSNYLENETKISFSLDKANIDELKQGIKITGSSRRGKDTYVWKYVNASMIYK